MMDDAPFHIRSGTFIFFHQRAREDYIRIARVFRLYRPTDPNQLDLYLHLLYTLAQELREDNPRFDFDRFVRECEA